MKVLLINPPYPFEESPAPPFGIMSLAAYIREKGSHVRIEDYIITPYSPERVKRTAAEFCPRLVGATGVTMNIKKSLSILKDYKSASPDAFTVLGGPHATFDAESILRDNPYVDFIVRGEGEITLTELIESIEMGKDQTGILGLSYRRDGVVVHNEMRPFIEDINILPYPARDLVQLNKYRAIGFAVNMVTSRGCPHKCIFCVGSKMVGRKVRYFATQRVVDEFQMLSKLGFSQINIVDDLFTSNKTRCIEICQEIMRRGIKHPWTVFARVDTVSRELLLAMKEAGCSMVCFGIESGNQEILNTVKKKITLEKCRQAVALCYEVGIAPMASYILGLPGETADTIRETMAFAGELTPHYGYHILAPFPGTEVREMKEHYGMRIFTDDWDKYDANQCVADTGSVPFEKIDEIVGEFNSGIKRYVESAVKRRRKGEPLSDNDRKMVDSLSNFFVVQDILQKELVEKYPGMNGGANAEAVVEDFAGFVVQHAGHPDDITRGIIGNLVEKKMLYVSGCGGRMGVRWN
ncbi:MAG: cobalamin-dependent protein [Spirochaetes bacterium]|nr:cobalamin-dependent protein [Spirochaetota bacterium]